MRDKFRVNFMIALPAALMVFGYYIFRGMDVIVKGQAAVHVVLPHVFLGGQQVSALTIVQIGKDLLYRRAQIGTCLLYTSIREVADYYGMSEPKVKSMLYRTRQGLKEYLEKEGYEL